LIKITYIYVYLKVNIAHCTVYLSEDIKFPFWLGGILYLEGILPILFLFHLCTVLLMGKLRQRKTGEADTPNPIMVYI
jgi:hypothetical protein